MTFLEFLSLPTSKKRKNPTNIQENFHPNAVCTDICACLFCTRTCACPWVQTATPGAAPVGCVCLKAGLAVRMERRKHE